MFSLKVLSYWNLNYADPQGVGKQMLALKYYHIGI